MDFFRTIAGSFFAASTYRTAMNGKGYGLLYSFLLVIGTSLIFTIWGMAAMHRFLFVGQDGGRPRLEAALHQIADQLPVMTIDKGQLQTQRPEASIITFRFDGENIYSFATIDTTGATTHENCTTPILITAKELIVIKRDEGKREVYALDKYFSGQKGPLVINRALAADTVDGLIAWLKTHRFTIYLTLGSFALGTMAGVCYVLRICMLLVLGLAGLLIANILRQTITYETAVRLAAVSYTPVALIDLLVWVTSWNAASTLALLGSGIVMLTAAMLVNRDAPLAASA